MKNWMTIIREHRDIDGSVAVIEHAGKFFCVRVVYSSLSDSGKGLVSLERKRKRLRFADGSRIICTFSPTGLACCATPRTRRGAMAAFRREVAREAAGRTA